LGVALRVVGLRAAGAATMQELELWLDEIAVDPARIGCVL
jgi:hypothetical protein